MWRGGRFCLWLQHTWYSLTSKVRTVVELKSMLSHMSGSTWMTAVWSPATLVRVRSLCPVVGRPLESVARRPTSAWFPRSRVSRSCSDVFSLGMVILVLRLCRKGNNPDAIFLGNNWNMQKICQLLSAIIGTFNLNKTIKKTNANKCMAYYLKRGDHILH